jgi:hypothetical protein
MLEHNVNKDIYGAAHFKIWQQYFHLIPILSICSTNLVELGLVQLHRVMEFTIAGLNGSSVVDRVHYDLSDGSDAKYATVRKHSNSYGAIIGGIKNKTGLLRIQIYEPMTQKFYFFCIPHAEYKGLKREIEIPFTKTGDPKRGLKQDTTFPNWWDYEVSSFEEMALYPTDEIQNVSKNTVYSDFFDEKSTEEQIA